MNLSPEQSRAARGWLDWSQQRLAQAAGVSESTVRDFEKGRRQPIAANLQVMAKALDVAGIELLFDRRGKGVGVRKRP
jgi:transcriptional regulator with XRE-family HTH domain